MNEHTCTSILLPCSCISSETEVFPYYTLFSHSFNHLFYSVKERSAVKSQLFLSTKNAWLDVITFQVHFLPLILLKSSIYCFKLLFHLCSESKLDTSNIENKFCNSSVIESSVLSIDWSDWIFFLLFCLFVLVSFNFTEPQNILSETNMNVKSI